MSNTTKILLSRTDGIGDVILSLPMAGILKKELPNCKIYFLGKAYTKAIIECSEHINCFLNWDEISALPQKQQLAQFKELNLDYFIHVFPNKIIAKLAFKAKIPNRIGTARRWYNTIYCNKILNFTRRKSNLHEAELNLKLLAPLIAITPYNKENLHHFYGLKTPNIESKAVSSIVNQNKIQLIFHPKSKGSAVEWSIFTFIELAKLLQADRLIEILVTGTTEERKLIDNKLFEQPNVVDCTGKLTLPELILLIAKSNGLVACSTGPLHIAAAFGIKTVGLYSSRRPIHPGRWMPLGYNAKSLVFDKNCPTCATEKQCDCITKITAKEVYNCLIN